jgi:hypothetical protein
MSDSSLDMFHVELCLLSAFCEIQGVYIAYGNLYKKGQALSFVKFGSSRSPSSASDHNLLTSTTRSTRLLAQLQVYPSTRQIPQKPFNCTLNRCPRAEHLPSPQSTTLLLLPSSSRNGPSYASTGAYCHHLLTPPLPIIYRSRVLLPCLVRLSRARFADPVWEGRHQEGRRSREAIL